MSSAHEDYVSFEKALRDLRLQSEELKKLVSEGEIRAFKDGGSMKFRREDVETLAQRRSAEDELVFADALEDDTGMVTEEMSDDDTLLADDDIAIEETVTTRRTTVAPATRSRARAVEVETASATPGWVIGAALLTSALMIWGAMLVFSIVNETPSALNLWASK